MNQRLYRSRDDRVLAGVAGGVADYFGVDPSIVRIVWAVLTLFSGGLLFLLYIIMWIVVPEEPYEWADEAAGTGSTGAPQPAGAPAAMSGGPVVASAATAQAAGTTDAVRDVEAAAAGPSSGEVGAGGMGALTGDATVPSGMAGIAETEAEEAEASAVDLGTQPAAGWVPPSATAGTVAPAVVGASVVPPATVAPPPAPVDPRAARRAERAARRAERRANRDPSGAVIFGIILVLIGAYFLVQMYVPGIDPGRFWPIVLVILGLVLLVAAFRPRSGTPPAP